MKILYGVPGEGMGHATRSKVIIDHLLSRDHDLCIVSSGRAFHFLDKAFPGKVIEIRGFHFAYKNASVSRSRTLLSNLKSSGKNLAFNTRRKLQIGKTFAPDLVISDFENFSYFYGKEHGIPVISIDNMQVMDRCTLEIQIPKSEKSNYLLARSIVKAKVPSCDHYLISSFFDAPVRKKNTTLVPPILRSAILDASPSTGSHILVYQTSDSLKTITETLRQLPDEKFIVYGMNQDHTGGNITFRPFSESGFISDFAGAKAVIANGGFSFISEAVYLRKPVYSFPIRNQFEQWMNAAYIQKCGYGRHFAALDADSLKAFLFDLSHFQKNLSTYEQDGNDLLFEKLDELVRQKADAS